LHFLPVIDNHSNLELVRVAVTESKYSTTYLRQTSIVFAPTATEPKLEWRPVIYHYLFKETERKNVSETRRSAESPERITHVLSPIIISVYVHVGIQLSISLFYPKEQYRHFGN